MATTANNASQDGIARAVSYSFELPPACKGFFAINQTLLKFHCQLTHKIPMEPMYMADGSIVDKGAAEQYIADAEKTGKVLRSLSSSKFMSKTLTPAEDVRLKIIGIQQNAAFILSLEMDALNGDIDAMKRLALFYRDGKHDLPKDMKEYSTWAVCMHKKRAELGKTSSMTKLGKWYLSGGGPFNVAKDVEQSYHWYMLAAEAGDVVGLCNASKCLLHGWGVQKNETHGIGLLVSAAEGGLDSACLRLGHYYLCGRHGIPANKALAQRWLRNIVDGKCRYRCKRLKEDAVVSAKKLLRYLSANS
mmetsp:Transcript_2082/g.5977  ORF Transcript_2082/g.5977 Transcript_2082/m.5977 type:complete len:304 (+) Transcript_2082:1470-2381(+)